MYFIYNNINNYNNNQYQDFYELLNKIDKQHVDHLIYEKDKKMTLLSRHLLSQLLNTKYNLTYHQLNIKYNKYNKPYIDNVYFNISHSHDYAIAVTSYYKVGVDIEKIRKVNLNIINIFCTEQEKQYILNSKNPYQSLFEIFCLKEAYFKMIGTGIYNPKQIEFVKNNQSFSCNIPNLNIKILYSLDQYIIAIIEEKF